MASPLTEFWHCRGRLKRVFKETPCAHPGALASLLLLRDLLWCFPWDILGYPVDILGMVLGHIRLIPAVLQPLVLWDGARAALLLPVLIQPCLEEWKGFGSFRGLWESLGAPQFLQEPLQIGACCTGGFSLCIPISNVF